MPIPVDGVIRVPSLALRRKRHVPYDILSSTKCMPAIHWPGRIINGHVSPSGIEIHSKRWSGRWCQQREERWCGGVTSPSLSYEFPYRWRFLSREAFSQGSGKVHWRCRWCTVRLGTGGTHEYVRASKMRVSWHSCFQPSSGIKMYPIERENVFIFPSPRPKCEHHASSSVPTSLFCHHPFWASKNNNVNSCVMSCMTAISYIMSTVITWFSWHQIVSKANLCKPQRDQKNYTWFSCSLHYANIKKPPATCIQANGQSLMLFPE